MNRQGKGKIKYLDYTWNPISGCLHGCDYCYAEKIAHRFGGKEWCLYNGFGLGQSYVAVDDRDYGNYEDLLVKNHVLNYRPRIPFPFGFEPTFHRYRLGEPAKLKKPSVIGVCFMGDLLHEAIPDEWNKEVFEACFDAYWHKYIFLTKNPKRYDTAIAHFGGKERDYGMDYWDNMWFGTTVTCQDDTVRIPELLKFSEGHKFISVEPFLGEIDIEDYPYPKRLCDGHPQWECDDNCNHRPPLEFVILGQQTNPSRPPKPEWVLSIVGQCRAAGVPVFIKNPLYQQLPIQEFPEGLRKTGLK